MSYIVTPTKKYLKDYEKYTQTKVSKKNVKGVQVSSDKEKAPSNDTELTPSNYFKRAFFPSFTL